MKYFINVILPIPIPKLYTYSVTEAEAEFISPGMRVAVEFGKSKVYTAIVANVFSSENVGYETKPIFQILDDKPIVTTTQLQFWEWISSYYMASQGEVYRTALPSALILESETEISRTNEVVDENLLSNDAFLVLEALEYTPVLSIAHISAILSKKNILPTLKELMENNVITIAEQLYEQYTPKLIQYVSLHERWNDKNLLNDLLEKVKNAPKQRQVLLTYFTLKATNSTIKLSALTEAAGVTRTIVNALEKKNIFTYYTLQEDRISFTTEENKIKKLTPEQQTAYTSITNHFKNQQTVLLNGVTSSGKTEIYSKLIEDTLANNKQVLYLVPEIALTTQLINRLKTYFGDNMSVFHSKFSSNERVEVYKNVLQNKQKAQLIIGARSAIFLPFQQLGLVIIDEEHEPSYKQFDPAPRYHARDAALVLAKLHLANVLLGSATPSIESFANTKNGKYQLVELDKRYGDVLLPEISIVDIKEKYRKKRMKGHFSDVLIEEIAARLERKEQIILFQNRRGYSPTIECEVCGFTPKCTQCDVSLTYHSYDHILKCHYCGYHQPVIQTCTACGSNHINTKGFGTEQIEIELKDLFPTAKVGRLDYDSTRKRHSYEIILDEFKNQEIDILVGTQMLSKGLDFQQVTLVGVLNADNMLNFPDFRSHERSYQMLTQVAGRAGRNKIRGKVLIQSFNPYHQILQQVTTHDYDTMFKEQLYERNQYSYPPYCKLIKITLKHKKEIVLEEGVHWLDKSFQNTFKKQVLGPTKPAISKIRNYYIRTFLIKIPLTHSASKAKQSISLIKASFSAIKEYRSIKFQIDVDNY